MIVTVIVPCYRSENTIESVVNEVKKEILKRKNNQYQIILINDCSPDNTFKIIEKISAKDKNIIGIDLARNYGQNKARMAALSYIKGDVVVCMDDDGQHPAEEIYTLVDKICEGYDLVYAHFTKRKQSLFRRFISCVNTKMLEVTGAKRKGIFNSSFLAWSQFAYQNLKKYHSPFPSAGAFLMNSTNKVANVDVKQRERIAGVSGYNLKKLLNLWLVELTNFSLVPLRFASLTGSCISGIGGIWGIYLVVKKILNPQIAVGYTSTMAVILFIGGMIMLMLGLIGEYIGKIYMTISDLPQYVIRKELNVNECNLEENQ